MKHYSEYGQEYKRIIRKLFRSYPESIRVNYSNHGVYDRLVSDGLAIFTGSGRARISDYGLDMMISSHP